MTADPRTLTTTLRQANEYENRTLRCAAAADLIEQVVVPLHDAWLKAKPPCPTCAVSKLHGDCGYHAFQINGHWVCNKCGFVAKCPDCPDGVLPFDKWTAGLVALWTELTDALAKLLADCRDADLDVSCYYADLVGASRRQIGGAR